MRRALYLLDQDDASGIDLLEAGLLGCLMLAPYLRLAPCLHTLRPADFVNPYRGVAFAAVMLERHPELGHVVARLEAEGHRPPPNRTGWGDALSRVMDLAIVDDDAVPEAVRRIREAALSRRTARRTNAA